MPAAKRHTSCSERFKAAPAFEGKRNVIQATSQRCSLLNFRLHDGLELRMTARVLVLFLFHDLLLDLDSSLEVPHHLHRIPLMPAKPCLQS
jgi:hypothetical protein